jgi:protein-S-isoprenylcysteine O-methyltransferase Ste14
MIPEIIRPWVYIVYAIALIGLAWLVFGVVVRRDYWRRGRLGLLSGTLELLVATLYVALPYIYLTSAWPPVQVGPLWALVGYTLVGLGLTGALGTMVVFGLGRAFGLVTDSLIQTGPYRISRNPQIVAFAVAMIGAVVLWPSWYAFGWLVLFAPVFHPMVLVEEEFLIRKFGADYQNYCRRAPRYMAIPGWRKRG